MRVGDIVDVVYNACQNLTMRAAVVIVKAQLLQVVKTSVLMSVMTAERFLRDKCSGPVMNIVVILTKK